MRRKYTALVGAAIGLGLLVAPAFAQWSGGAASNSPYDNSTLMQNQAGASKVKHLSITRIGTTTWTTCNAKAVIIQ